MRFAKVAVAILVISSVAAADDRKYELQREMPTPWTVFRAGSSYSALSPDGKALAEINAGQLAVRQLASGEESILLPKGSVAALPSVWTVWAPDGKSLYYL